jgi:uncharacterized protein
MEFTEDFINGLQIDAGSIIKKISEELNISINKTSNTVKLLKEENTIPFIARYRKEAIGFLDEEEVRNIFHKLIFFENIENRKIEIIKTIFNRGLLTEDLYNNINKAGNFSELEDIYAPYKQKKKTRAMIAIEKGLASLADLMEKIKNIEDEAVKFIDPEKGVNTKEDALQGAMDIIAEKIAHDIDIRTIIKNFIFKTGTLNIEGLKDEESSVYKMYYNYSEPLAEIKPHRVLAINRGEKEEELKVNIDYEKEECLEILLNRIKPINGYYKNALEDGLDRLLLPSILREIRNSLTEKSDSHGIEVFAKNLFSLLMTPPIKKSRIIGIDPGIRTGSKGAVLDVTGKILDYFVFNQMDVIKSKEIIKSYVNKHNINLIAIGNGTGTQEVQTIVAELISEFSLPVEFTVVSEDGASVYSASEAAREEFPDLDLTIRGAISIGRRLQDPLAELVKIDPRSIGVGLYQHDVNQARLSETLDEVVQSVVNKVGVNLNTASFHLLKYVSGISNSTAKNIVKYREENGIIRSREELKKINGIGEKTFEQAAGFLKIQESDNQLDNTWVHPENYEIAKDIFIILKTNKNLNTGDIDSIAKKHGVSENLVKEIIEELKKPNLDPREDYPKPILQKGVISFDDLRCGMKVTGKIKNVVDFGAFVDIGIKETALLHISQISNKFIKDVHLMLKVGDIKEFTIIDIDENRKRISLSLKKNLTKY